MSEVRGVDIGVGANCIYPLLGRGLHSSTIRLKVSAF